MRLTRLTSEVGDIKGRLCDLQETALDDPSGASNRPFTSRRVLQQYLSPEGIGQFLELYKLGDLNANVINQHYVAVFATLIQIGKPEKIVYFYRHDHFADEHLPFRERQSWPQECHAFFDDFQRAQWVFCAQELRRDRLYNKRIDPERIIPIISRTHLKQGPDATVYKVEVHPDYNSLVRRVSTVHLLFSRFKLTVVTARALMMSQRPILLFSRPTDATRATSIIMNCMPIRCSTTRI